MKIPNEKKRYVFLGVFLFLIVMLLLLARCIIKNASTDSIKSAELISNDLKTKTTKIIFWLGGEPHKIEDTDKIHEFYDILSTVKYTKVKNVNKFSRIEGGDMYDITTSTDELRIVVNGDREIRYDGVSYNVDRDVSGDLYFLFMNEKR